jgi:anti-anti-sigma factor
VQFPDGFAAAVNVVVGGALEEVGKFRFEVASDTWWWSDAVYGMYGFAPHEVVPTTELLSAHRHPDDRAESVDELVNRLAHGGIFASRRQIVDTRQVERVLVITGEAFTGPGGTVSELRGMVVDITAAYGRAAAQYTNAAWSIDPGREVIEQAKGALMLVYGMDADAAFELLSWYSQRGNVKLRSLAELLVSTARQGVPISGPDHRRLDELLVGLATAPQSTVPDRVRPAVAGRVGELSTSTDVVGDTVVLRVTGEVDLATGPQFTAALAAVAGQVRAPAPVVVDLTGVAYLGSIGVALLSKYHRRSIGRNTPLRVVATGGGAAGPLRSSGLPLYDTIDDAISGASTH